MPSQGLLIAITIACFSTLVAAVAFLIFLTLRINGLKREIAQLKHELAAQAQQKEVVGNNLAGISDQLKILADAVSTNSASQTESKLRTIAHHIQWMLNSAFQ